MYPQPELTRLAARQAALREEIACRRTQSVAAAVRVARPLAWLDQMLALGRQLSALARAAARLPNSFPRRDAVDSTNSSPAPGRDASPELRPAGKTPAA